MLRTPKIVAVSANLICALRAIIGTTMYVTVSAALKPLISVTRDFTGIHHFVGATARQKTVLSSLTIQFMTRKIASAGVLRTLNYHARMAISLTATPVAV
jgi:hypothetical protein